MRCDTAQRRLSDRLDDPVADGGDAVDAHLETCPRCRGFEQRLDRVRRHLHVTPAATAPDVAPRVRRELEEAARPGPTPVAPRRRLLPQVAAAFVVAFALAASAVGLAGPERAGATDVTSLVLGAQQELSSLTARVEVVERGWHPEVPERRYEGRLAYAAPETLAVQLHDRTSYPAGPWPPNDVTVVVEDARSFSSGLAPCPPAGLPECLPAEPQVRAVEGREPLDQLEPVPLDLVLPVASFAVGGDEAPLDEADRDGRPTVGVEVTAARIQPLLDGIIGTGNWRQVHPTDAARVWLDADYGVPLRVDVHATAGFERDRWATASGLDDPAGSTVLSWRLTDVRVNDDEEVTVPARPAGAEVTDRGFRVGDPRGPQPAWLPPGMAPHRSGHIDGVDVTGFSDGRAWVTVRTTSEWTGSRLFGQQADVVRRVGLPDGGVAYVAEGGHRVLLHGDGVDAEVVGSLPPEDLLRVAASLGLRGRPVPDHWAEAATTTLAEAATARPGLLTVPPSVDGYTGPAVALSDGGVVQSFAGGGARAVVLAQTTGDELGPPLDGVVLAVEVRGRPARFTPSRGTLEWVEDGQVVTLRSRSVGLAELTRLADALRPATTDPVAEPTSTLPRPTRPAS